MSNERSYDERTAAERAGAVGYKRPPVEHRFRKGQSGNPSGRPRHPRSFLSLLGKELSRRVEITENGRKRRLTKRQAAARRLADMIARGDLAALKFAMGMLDSIDDFEDPAQKQRQQEAETFVVGLLNEMAALKADPYVPRDVEDDKEA